ncbi:MAG TPA: ABC transporter permease [Chitinophagaceae bacterium]|nr:ABC transporter permease [Chitinophagaceae bacterium]
MNSFTLHITLYDLFFFAMIIVGLTFALLLSFVKTVNRSANRFLALALVTMVLWMVRVLAFDLMPGIRLPVQFLLALGPLLYFYVLKITRPRYKFGWKDLLHFSPLLLEQAVLPFQQFNPVLQLLIFISVITYLYRCKRLIEHFYRQLPLVLMDRSRLEFRWLRRLLAATALLWMLWISYAAVDYFGYHNQLSVHLYYPFYIFFAVIIIWTAAAAFLKPQAAVLAQTPLSLKPPVPVELKAKGAWLKRSMEAKKYYEDPGLSLGSLAEKLAMHPHELSRVINTALKKNFNDFVNEYRVRDVVSKMKDPAYDNITLLGIAFDAGFNSQSTFSRIFKQMTGKSPLEYKNELEKEFPSYNLRSRAPFTTVISNHQTTHKWDFVKLNRKYMFKNYFTIALRGFWRHKLFTLINIIGLSIGISATVVIFLIVQYDFSFDKFHKDSDRIYRVVSNFSYQGNPGHTRGVSGTVAPAIRSSVSGVEVTATVLSISPDVFIPSKKGAPVKFAAQDKTAFTEPGYFKIFDYTWLAGSPETSLNAPNQVVLTSNQAKLYFPSLPYNQVLGKVITYDTLPATVTGIVQTFTQNSDLAFSDFISFSTVNTSKDLQDMAGLTNWGGTSSSNVVFTKLLPGTRPASIENQLNTILKKESPPQKGSTRSFSMEKFADIHFDEKYGVFDFSDAASKTTLTGLLIIAAFLLVLACINFINLTTAQASQRAKEIGVRKTMGSTRTQLIVQFLSETFLITLFAVFFSIVLAPVILKLFADFIPVGVKVSLLFQPVVILFLGVLTIVVSVLSGFYPAVMLSCYQPVQVLKNQAQTGSKSRNAWLRKSLTVSQFVIAQFFIMATVMVGKQVYYALHKNLGFKKDAIVVFDAPFKKTSPSKNLIVLNKLKALPQVAMAGIGADAPASGGTRSTEGIYVRSNNEIKTDVELKFGDTNYIKIYQIKLLAGRNIMPSDTAKALLINNAYAKLMGFKNPGDAVGKTFKLDGKPMMIAGVMGDFSERSLHSAINPLALQYAKGDFETRVWHVALKPETPGGHEWKTAIAGMQKAFKEAYPDDEFNYTFYDQAIAKFYSSEQHTATLLTWASGLSILISCLGLLGLAIYTTNQRTKEIGVRKVLGASVAQIVRLLSAELVMLILLAFVIVTPVAWWSMNYWMQDFADRTPISWWIFAASGAAMLLVALFTSGVQTVRAAIANPVKSLRSE